MGGQPPGKTSTNAGAKSTPAQLKRQQRLAEELRANLKRRKAAARRHKEDGMVDDDDAGDVDPVPGASKAGDGSGA
ncbi:hypothetical protein [Hyphomicrobium sp.]|uniref:hypothetical protein n=1 Tax=Hyphomicrobium sp. TaxID=82 RepID=UPI000FAE9C6E|nr:hypothetical protein [Hyphomicrobium sp.]RUO99724.1 MAG: hypothetical protein EKK30_04465 [Hyphomicrobium sp.]